MEQVRHIKDYLAKVEQENSSIGYLCEMRRKQAEEQTHQKKLLENEISRIHGDLSRMKREQEDAQEKINHFEVSVVDTEASNCNKRIWLSKQNRALKSRLPRQL